jgi:lipoate-protein ligase B
LDKLTTEGIGFARVVRGGGITFHWPGQVVCCPIMLLHPDSRDVGGFMAKLERVAVAALAAFGISAETRRDTPAHIGLWHRGKKIVSMGVRIRNWVTGFGFAINVSGDYSPAKYIRPCGIRDATLVDMASILGYAPPRCEVKAAVAEGFSTVFGRETRALTPEAPGFHVAEKIIRAHSQGTE